MEVFRVNCSDCDIMMTLFTFSQSVNGCDEGRLLWCRSNLSLLSISIHCSWSRVAASVSRCLTLVGAVRSLLGHQHHQNSGAEKYCEEIWVSIRWLKYCDDMDPSVSVWWWFREILTVLSFYRNLTQWVSRAGSWNCEIKSSERVESAQSSSSLLVRVAKQWETVLQHQPELTELVTNREEIKQQQIDAFYWNHPPRPAPSYPWSESVTTVKTKRENISKITTTMVHSYLRQ